MAQSSADAVLRSRKALAVDPGDLNGQLYLRVQVRVRAAVQLLLVQACGEVHAVHAGRMPPPALATMLDTLEALSAHARRINDDMTLRRALAFAQAEDQVSRSCLVQGLDSVVTESAIFAPFKGGLLLPLAYTVCLGDHAAIRTAGLNMQHRALAATGAFVLTRTQTTISAGRPRGRALCVC